MPCQSTPTLAYLPIVHSCTRSILLSAPYTHQTLANPASACSLLRGRLLLSPRAARIPSTASLDDCNIPHFDPQQAALRAEFIHLFRCHRLQNIHADRHSRSGPSPFTLRARCFCRLNPSTRREKITLQILHSILSQPAGQNKCKPVFLRQRLFAAASCGRSADGASHCPRADIASNRPGNRLHGLSQKESTLILHYRACPSHIPSCIRHHLFRLWLFAHRFIHTVLEPRTPNESSCDSSSPSGAHTR